jgi:gluconolactonase
MDDMRLVAGGLRFPEGPVVLADGSVLVTEMARGCVTIVRADGSVDRIDVGGGPNGAAVGPDGRVYVCNNGGYPVTDVAGALFPGVQPGGVSQPDDYRGGSIQRVDIETGEVDVLYEQCDGHQLKGPNDIVFDSTGGFWFTDHGKVRARDEDRGGLYYATADGSSVVEVAFGLHQPNGVGLSPQGDAVFVVETPTARLFRWDLAGPGQLSARPTFGHGGRFVAGVGGFQFFDSLAIDGAGRVCVATIAGTGITVIDPDSGQYELRALPAEFHDPFITNIAFGGDDLRTAYITLSSSGRLVACKWPEPGLALAF